MIGDGVMFNAYPESCGGDLAASVALLRRREFAGTFRYFYVLPTMFRSDLDRGFSVISYDLNEELAQRADLAALMEMGIELKLDFVLNHLSVQSPQFQDLLKNGEASPHVDTFIDWNRFWQGQGEMDPAGYIVPAPEHLNKLFMRKPGLPILRIPFPDGSSRYYWNTFYQQITVDPPEAGELAEALSVDESTAAGIAHLVKQAVSDGRAIRDEDFGDYGPFQEAVAYYLDRHCTRYLGQMDLNARSAGVWRFYEETLDKLASYGARVVRLDAFAYLHKQVGESNFFNEPGTWEYLDRLRAIADRHEITLLPEIHSRYEDRIHEKLAERGYPFYDFFFPGLVIDAIETGTGERLAAWIHEIRDKGYQTINMLGCHDGIPVLDVKGLLEDAAIDRLIDVITGRGGRIKDLYGPDGKRISYYQVNATFFSALGEDEDKMLLARAIQLFMPGIPQVWYLDIFAGTNDHEAADAGGHKEINRTNLSTEEMERRLSRPIVQRQLALLKFRNTFPAFGSGADLTVEYGEDGRLVMRWEQGGHSAGLSADLAAHRFTITYRDGEGKHTLQV